ncbi:MAG: hypothetical protein LW688_13320 [Cryomorphaceae bacterium]|jgi:hypothetical protein|nr:hypothetical protein [Cryomorphaceae bacterium]
MADSFFENVTAHTYITLTFGSFSISTTAKLTTESKKWSPLARAHKKEAH